MSLETLIIVILVLAVIGTLVVASIAMTTQLCIWRRERLEQECIWRRERLEQELLYTSHIRYVLDGLYIRDVQ